jgi:lysozyme
MSTRTRLAALSLSAAGLVGILNWEGYSDRAYVPVEGDVPTIGYGSTRRDDGAPVKPGDTITPPQALRRALKDVKEFEGAIKECVSVPLTQYEYDAYLSLSYNIGSTAFCNSTLVRKLNAEDYEGACKEILRWNKFKGKPLAGLTNRRRAEYVMCMGG